MTSLAVLPFTGVPKNAGEYTFDVRQTYSDGSVVEWSGAESSDTPAARIEATSGHEPRRRSSDSGKTIAIIALVVGALGAGRRRRRARLGQAFGVRIGGRAGTLLVAVMVALAVPTVAWGHASLLATQPEASGVLSHPPTEVRLTYSERIEPRFAIVSVTDAAGRQQIAGSPARSRRTTPTRIFVPLKSLPQGWYLVWWRVISADGHPVRGAFTFAVGPSPGPPPQFVIPSLGESAATPSLVSSALGAAARDDGGHRPARIPRRDRPPAAGGAAGASARCAASPRRPRSRSPSRCSPPPPISCSRPRSSRSDRGATSATIVPLVRDSSFGRAFSDLWGVLALLAVGERDRARARPARTRAALRGGAARRDRRRGLRRGGARPPGPRRPPLDDQPGRPHAGARLGAPARRRRSGSAASLGLLVLAAAATPAGNASRRSRSSSRASRARPWRSVAAAARHRHRREHRAPPDARLAVGDGLRQGADREERPARLRARARRRQPPALAPPPEWPPRERRDRALGDGAARLLRRLVLGEAALLAGAVVAAAILTSIAPPSTALAQRGQVRRQGRSRRRRAHVHARRRAHRGRHRPEPRGDRQRLRRCISRATAQPVRTRGSRPSSTCST